MSSILLGVNIDHVATLRQARGTSYPNLLESASIAIAAGADSITVHLREDRRHIQDKDVLDLMSALTVPLNLELAITDEMLGIAEQTKPKYCCFVPENREELTTEGGMDVVGNKKRVMDACQRMKDSGIRASLFIDADPIQIHAASECGANVIEIHTGRYADASQLELQNSELNKIIDATSLATNLGLQVNAGHGLNINNVHQIAAIKKICELNIGHSIISQAVFDGLSKAVSEIKKIMQQARL